MDYIYYITFVNGHNSYADAYKVDYGKKNVIEILRKAINQESFMQEVLFKMSIEK